MDISRIVQVLKLFTDRGITKNSIDDYLLVSFPRRMMETPTIETNINIAEKLGKTLNDKTVPKNFYVHFEQCTRRCTGCHYGVLLYENKDKQMFGQVLFNQLIKNIQLFPKEDYKIEDAVIFFGGGTPSLMSANQVSQIYRTLRNRFDIHSITEATLEIHPEVAFQKENLNTYLKELKDIGITRLSLGIQDTNDDVLKKWHRGHNQNHSLITYELIKNNG